jgi:hypothetical protein
VPPGRIRSIEKSNDHTGNRSHNFPVCVKTDDKLACTKIINSIKRNYFREHFLWGGTKSLGTAATSGLLYKPQMIDEGDCGAIGGIKIGRGKRSTRRKPAPATLCPPQIPHDQTRARTRAAAVGSQRLTA